ncbi:hypothetical protein [Kitasatospora acidiphila]|uniref:hypothetical protein n=1 Tax=Kitasatospora acidiphila TaxID=2567942 RepID=UPI0015F0EDB2|nr:hypothetical protein [Kitasatospora acidiphila]
MPRIQPSGPNRGVNHIRHHWAIWTSLAGVIAATVVVGAWWRPWRAVELPQSACWSVLSKPDYQTLAGDDGKATEDSIGSIDGPLQPGSSQCYLGWSAKRRDPILTVLITSTAINSGRSTISILSGGEARSISFGPDTAGLFGDGRQSAVDLVLRCDHQQAGASGSSSSPYVEISVTGASDVPVAPRSQVRQTYANIALKLAKAIVRRLPCTNNVQLADQAPVLPPPIGS